VQLTTSVPAVKSFLAQRGLVLSEEKTGIVHIERGFDFLGQNIRKYNGKLLIKPTRNAVQGLMANVRQILKTYSGGDHWAMITRLNRTIYISHFI
jgi:RNA-directed DNA polymerase